MKNEKNSVLEIHGTILEPGKDYSKKHNTFWNNIEKIAPEKNDLMVFKPEELMLHLCIHLSYRDGFNLDLRHYYDIVKVFEYYGGTFNWGSFIRDAQERKWEKGVYLVLKITEKIFEINFPCIVESLNYETKENKADFINIAIDLMWEYDRSSEKHKATTRYFDYLDKTITGKIKVALRTLFFLKIEVSQMYSLKTHSPKIYFYYVLRLFQLLKKHKSNLLKIGSDHSFAEYLHKRAILYNWLNG
jgi:hypothetical protein